MIYDVLRENERLLTYFILICFADKLELLAATNEISKFWNAVCCGNVECNDSILSFAEDGLSWMINENVPMIYERNVYKEIFEELCAGKSRKCLSSVHLELASLCWNFT